MPKTTKDRMMEHFGQRLRASRIAMGYGDAKRFAEKVGVASPRYRKYERGESLPPIDVLNQICIVLDRSSDWLLYNRLPLTLEKLKNEQGEI